MQRLSKVMMLVMVACALSATACKKKQEVPDDTVTASVPQAKEVMLYQDRFNPNTLTISAGTSVKFVNKDPERHNVRIAALNIDEMVDSGSSWSHTFDTAGEFAVDNRLATNPMSMTIVVQ